MTQEEMLIPSSLAALDPDEQVEVLKEIADEFQETYYEDLDDLMDKGELIFGRFKPREMLQGFLEDTLPQDIPLVLDPDYIAKRRAGLAPELLAEMMIKETERLTAEHEALTMQAEQQAMMTGVPAMPIPPPQLPPPAPPLWPGLLPSDLAPTPFPDRVFIKMAGKFRTLLHEQRRREEREG